MYRTWLNYLSRSGRERLKRLEKIWYDRLKSTGFNDIEDTDVGLLKEWDTNFFRNRFVQVKFDATTEYYSCAHHILLHHEFKNENHKRVWELHCQGYSERKIAQMIKVYKKSMVHYVIAMIAKVIRG